MSTFGFNGDDLKTAVTVAVACLGVAKWIHAKAMKELVEKLVPMLTELLIPIITKAVKEELEEQLNGESEVSIGGELQRISKTMNQVVKRLNNIEGEHG